MSLLSRGSSGSYCRVQSPQYLRGGKQETGEGSGASAQLGHALQQEVDARRDQRARLRLVPTLQLVEPARRLFPIRIGRKAVDGVEREDDGLALAQSSDGLVGDVHRLPSTTRSSP